MDDSRATMLIRKKGVITIFLCLRFLQGCAHDNHLVSEVHHESIPRTDTAQDQGRPLRVGPLIMRAADPGSSDVIHSPLIDRVRHIIASEHIGERLMAT